VALEVAYRPGMSGPVIVGVDARDQSRDAVELGHRLARNLDRKLVLAHVVAPTPPGWGGVEFERVIRQEGRELLERTAASIGDPTVERHILEWPSTAWALHDLAEDIDASLLVVGSAHRGAIGRLLLGSVSHGLVTGAPCPVAVAPVGYRDQASDVFRLVGVAYDGSREADAALDLAITIAQASGAELRLWFVVAPTGWGGATPERYAELTEYMHAWARKHLARGLDRIPPGIRSTSEVLEGDAAHAIAEAALAAQAALLICGSRGYGPLRRVVAGSTARRLLDGTGCPVVLVPRPAEAGDARVRHEAL
jgi:nucleotide-binding universal stress UspA family protein